MVNPIYLIVLILASAFLLALLHRINHFFAYLLFYLVNVISLIVSGLWSTGLLSGKNTIQVFTAGFYPPYSINLQIGLPESVILFLTNLILFLGAIYLWEKFKKEGVQSFILYLTLSLGFLGIILSRDLFNLFVFLEIASISTAILIGLDLDQRAISAGFKYMVAGGLISAFMLIGIIFIYKETGTLSLDLLNAVESTGFTRAGLIALFLLFAAVLIELKPFPANGWALDVYQAASPGLAAIISTASSGAVLFILYKLLPLASPGIIQFIIISGIVTFVSSNLIGLKQTDARRLLGYSSIAQLGLLSAAMGLMDKFGIDLLSWQGILIIGGLFINHFFSKAGLFWISGLIDKNKIGDWSVLFKYPPLSFLFGCFIFAISCLPPFPGFWAKWELILTIFRNGESILAYLILAGSLLETAYLFRWLIKAVKGYNTSSEPSLKIKLSKLFPIFIMFVLIIYFSLIITNLKSGFNFNLLLPLIGGAIFFALSWLPARLKTILLLFFLALATYYIYPQLTGISRYFGLMFSAGSMIFVFANGNSLNTRSGIFENLTILISSLLLLLTVKTTLNFFYAWELMTISSFLLLLKGNKSARSALTFLLFSIGSAYLLLSAFGLAHAETNSILWESLAMLEIYKIPVFILLAAGFLIKSGVAGFHIWMPGAYAEADDETTPLFSAILSKSGIFGLVITLGIIGEVTFNGLSLTIIIGWLGILTAFWGSLLAVFQEDIKYLLAYSSMGQIGYIILALAVNSHTGWVAAVYLSINHLLFKGALFLAAAGLISRLQTRKMYEMGGLIKKMPLSFITVLISIIALSGVPPLSGFGSKWLLYNALLEKGWYLQTGLAFFASTIAFLYCFRLIHTVFLGQGKPAHKQVKEASSWFIIPQIILLLAIMILSMFPHLFLQPLSNTVSHYFQPVLSWQGITLFSSLGYWNGNLIMIATMIIFMIPLIWLLLRIPAIKKVKQFNIVYAAERPDKPETTHFAYNFFAPYQKALGGLTKPVATKFWSGISEGITTLGAAFRHIYTGNGQTYALHIIFFIIIYYLITGAG